MSIWIYRKDKNGKPSVFSVTIPLEVLVLFLGLLAGILGPRYIYDTSQVGKDSIVLVSIGFLLFLFSKISLFKKGIWNSWGPNRMNKPFNWFYVLGYLFMVVGVIGIFKFI